jgi:hypothetical protein
MKTNLHFRFLSKNLTPYRHQSVGSLFSWTTTAPILINFCIINPTPVIKKH